MKLTSQKKEGKAQTMLTLKNQGGARRKQLEKKGKGSKALWVSYELPADGWDPSLPRVVERAERKKRYTVWYWFLRLRVPGLIGAGDRG